MSSLYWVSIALTVVANILYHVFQKQINGDANLFASLVLTYSVALLISGGFLLGSVGPKGVVLVLAGVNWAAYALGAAIILLEAGFLLAYRSGWDVSVAALYTNVIVGVLLIPVGVLAWNEALTLRRGAGIALAVLAIALLSGRGEAPAQASTAAALPQLGEAPAAD